MPPNIAAKWVPLLVPPDDDKAVEELLASVLDGPSVIESPVVVLGKKLEAGSDDGCCASVMGDIVIESGESVDEEALVSEAESWVVDVSEIWDEVDDGGGRRTVCSTGFGDITFTKSKRKVDPLTRLVIVRV